jgi:hypothetical protein
LKRKSGKFQWQKHVETVLIVDVGQQQLVSVSTKQKYTLSIICMWQKKTIRQAISIDYLANQKNVLE